MFTSNLNHENKEPNNKMGITMTDTDGTQYFVFGKSKIKITEHFVENGKPIGELVTDLIQQKIKEKIA